jgi:hypothetical protein
MASHFMQVVFSLFDARLRDIRPPSASRDVAKNYLSIERVTSHEGCCSGKQKKTIDKRFLT